MKKERIVVALGGNALGNNAKEQLELVKQTAKPIVDLIEEGHEIVIAHGNGPQVGMINMAFDNPDVPDMPFPECGAMSQGYIGYHLQNAIQNELASRNIKKNVTAVVTQVLVDKDDKAFENPTKPIGIFYSEEEAKKIADEKGFVMKEDSGRGYRRVVPSPKPVDVVEKEVINELVASGNIVIAVGGGGIPVVNNNGRLEGVAAVIDKDFASAKLAELVSASYLIILTAVEKIALNFGKENEKWLGETSTEDMKKYSAEGHFAPGSMLPKVEASIAFAESSKDRKALITSLEKAKEGIAGKTGTTVY
ncbi:MAG: carbamate kinase [Clostridiales bacterium]|nr:MAG: carbamate kinase [Clostridiales bacterium]